MCSSPFDFQAGDTGGGGLRVLIVAKSAAIFQSLLQDEYRMSADAVAQRLVAYDEFAKQVASRTPNNSGQQGRRSNAEDDDDDDEAATAKEMSREQQPAERQWEFDAAVEMQAAQDLTVHRLKVRDNEFAYKSARTLLFFFHAD